MPRSLRVVDAAEPLAVRDALVDALAGGTPMLPRLDGPTPDDAAALELDGVWPDDVCLVIETSGSTAAPKRVVLTATSLRASGSATEARLGGAPGPAGAAPAQWLLCLPASYVAGAQVLVRSILAGTEPVIATPGRFDAAGFARDLERMHDGPRRTSLVPVQLLRLLETAEGPGAEAALVREAVAGLDTILVGGQATPPPVRARAAALGWTLVTTYGASETSGGCVYNGVPLDGVEMRVVDGEVQLAGDVLAAGYLGDPARTANAFVVDEHGRRWYRTGDAGSVDASASGDVGRVQDEAGGPRLRITGRFDNVIISGGEKVLLDRVEQLVRGVDGYADAVVVGVPSEQWGEVPAVVIRDASAGETPIADGPDALANDSGWARVRDATAAAGRAARPHTRIRVLEVPRLVSGKPDRREITAIASRAVRTAPNPRSDDTLTP